MRKLLIAVIVLSGVGAMPAAAQETTHGCACIHNKTNTTISYRYKWGDGQWQNFKLQPANQTWICWKYDTVQKSSPNLSFQLDVDMSIGSAWTTYAAARA